MQTLLSSRPTPPPDAALQEDWFFGQTTESFLAQWQRRAEQQPRLYLWVFSIFWLVWTLAYMATMHRHEPPMVAVHAAPHIGYSAIVFGAILFPHQNWWLPMGLFAGLFALTLPSAEMQPFLRDGTGMTLGAVTFALNMALGLIAAYLAQHLAPRIVARHPEVGQDVVLLCALFVSAPLVAVVIHLSEWLIVVALRGQEAALALYGYGAESALHVLHRGIRAGIVAVVLLVIFIRPPKRREVRLIAISLPFFGLLVLAQTRFGLIFPELQLATVMLAYAVLMPPAVTAAVIMGVVWPFAFWSGIFVQPIDSASSEHVLTEAVSSLLIVLLALLITNRLQSEIRNRRRDSHMLRMKRVRDLADVGRFTLDPQAGWISIDSAAQRLTGAPATSDLDSFARHLDEDSQSRLTAILMRPSEHNHALTLHRPERPHLPALDLRISFWSDTDPFGHVLFHGYLVNVTEEYTREAKLRFALAQLTGQGDSNTQGVDMPEL